MWASSLCSLGQGRPGAGRRSLSPDLCSSLRSNTTSTNIVPLPILGAVCTPRLLENDVRKPSSYLSSSQFSSSARSGTTAVILVGGLPHLLVIALGLTQYRSLCASCLFPFLSKALAISPRYETCLKRWCLAFVAGEGGDKPAPKKKDTEG